VRRVLFDENVPRNLRRDLPDFTIRTVQQEGWAGLKNGTLLQRASLSFDVVVTVDQRMRYQQNISSFNIGVVVVEAYDTTLPNLRLHIGEIKSAISTVLPGAVAVVTTT
jgi:hypothetical protein